LRPAHSRVKGLLKLPRSHENRRTEKRPLLWASGMRSSLRACRAYFRALSGHSRLAWCMHCAGVRANATDAVPHSMRSWCSLLCAPWPQQSLRFGSTKRILQLRRQRPVRRTVATHTVPRSPVCFGALHACGVLTGWKSAGWDAYGSRYPYGYPHSPFHSPGDYGHTPHLFHSQREGPEDKYQRGNLISPRSGLRMDHVAHRHDERSRRDDRDIRRENPTGPSWEDGDPIQRTERTRAQRAAAPTPQSLPESPDSFLPERVHENRLREVLSPPTPTCLHYGPWIYA
jgi:hypothetical protein